MQQGEKHRLDLGSSLHIVGLKHRLGHSIPVQWRARPPFQLAKLQPDGSLYLDHVNLQVLGMEQAYYRVGD